MTEPKTRPGVISVAQFMKTVDDPQIRADCRTISRMMRHATGKRARMWGTSIVGFGSYEARYASGRRAPWPLCGYSPRKQNLAIYIMPGFSRYRSLLRQLGRHRTGKSCLYIRRLADVDETVLQAIIEDSVKFMEKKYNSG